MSYAIEIFYLGPPDARREAEIERLVTPFDGRLDFREPPTSLRRSTCLTIEFGDPIQAAEAAACLGREDNLHVEGPTGYADEVPAAGAPGHVTSTRAIIRSAPAVEGIPG